jgi:hypothetical protein
MKLLVELISFLASREINTIETPRQDSAQSLMDGIGEGSIKTREDAESKLFPKTTHQSLYYRRAKNRLIPRLINSILSTNEEKNPNRYDKVLVRCHRARCATHILISKGRRRAATLIAQEYLKTARIYHFTDLIIDFLEVIRDSYTSSGNQNEFKKYQDLLIHYRDIKRLEGLAMDYHRDMEIKLSISKNPSADAIQLCKEYSNTIKRMALGSGSFKINYCAFSLDAIYYQMIKDYDQLRKNSEEALEYFSSLDFDSNLPKRAFLSFLIPILIMDNQFTEANQRIDEVLVNITKGSRNWIIFHQYKAIIGFYSKDYQTSLDIVNKTKKFIANKKLSQEFRIYEAFIHLLFISGRIKGDPGKFRLGKFLNEVTTQEKDKKGMNVNVLILQIIFYLYQKEWGKIIDRMEPIQTYRYRHLNEDSSIRNNQFLKLLLLLPKHNFILEPIKAEAQPILKELEETPSNLMNHLDMEIVPYPTLWEITEEMLL